MDSATSLPKKKHAEITKVYKEKLERKEKLIRLLKDLLQVRDESFKTKFQQHLAPALLSWQDNFESLKKELLTSASSTHSLVQAKEEYRKSNDEISESLRIKTAVIAHLEFQTKQLSCAVQELTAKEKLWNEKQKLDKKTDISFTINGKKKKLKDSPLDVFPPTPASSVSTGSHHGSESPFRGNLTSPASSSSSNPSLPWLESLEILPKTNFEANNLTSADAESDSELVEVLPAPSSESPKHQSVILEEPQPLSPISENSPNSAKDHQSLPKNIYERVIENSSAENVHAPSTVLSSVTPGGSIFDVEIVDDECDRKSRIHNSNYISSIVEETLEYFPILKDPPTILIDSEQKLSSSPTKMPSSPVKQTISYSADLIFEQKLSPTSDVAPDALQKVKPGADSIQINKTGTSDNNPHILASKIQDHGYSKSLPSSGQGTSLQESPPNTRNIVASGSSSNMHDDTLSKSPIRRSSYSSSASNESSKDLDSSEHESTTSSSNTGSHSTDNESEDNDLSSSSSDECLEPDECSTVDTLNPAELTSNAPRRVSEIAESANLEVEVEPTSSPIADCHDSPHKRIEMREESDSGNTEEQANTLRNTCDQRKIPSPSLSEHTHKKSKVSLPSLQQMPEEIQDQPSDPPSKKRKSIEASSSSDAKVVNSSDLPTAVEKFELPYETKVPNYTSIRSHSNVGEKQFILDSAQTTSLDTEDPSQLYSEPKECLAVEKTQIFHASPKKSARKKSIDSQEPANAAENHGSMAKHAAPRVTSEQSLLQSDGNICETKISSKEHSKLKDNVSIASSSVENHQSTSELPVPNDEEEFKLKKSVDIVNSTKKRLTASYTINKLSSDLDDLANIGSSPPSSEKLPEKTPPLRSLPSTSSMNGVSEWNRSVGKMSVTSIPNSEIDLGSDSSYLKAQRFQSFADLATSQKEVACSAQGFLNRPATGFLGAARSSFGWAGFSHNGTDEPRTTTDTFLDNLVFGQLCWSFQLLSIQKAQNVCLLKQSSKPEPAGFLDCGGQQRKNAGLVSPSSSFNTYRETTASANIKEEKSDPLQCYSRSFQNTDKPGNNRCCGTSPFIDNDPSSHFTNCVPAHSSTFKEQKSYSSCYRNNNFKGDNLNFNAPCSIICPTKREFQRTSHPQTSTPSPNGYPVHHQLKLLSPNSCNCSCNRNTTFSSLGNVFSKDVEQRGNFHKQVSTCRDQISSQLPFVDLTESKQDSESVKASALNSSSCSSGRYSSRPPIAQSKFVFPNFDRQNIQHQELTPFTASKLPGICKAPLIRPSELEAPVSLVAARNCGKEMQSVPTKIVSDVPINLENALPHEAPKVPPDSQNDDPQDLNSVGKLGQQPDGKISSDFQDSKIDSSAEQQTTPLATTTPASPPKNQSSVNSKAPILTNSPAVTPTVPTKYSSKVHSVEESIHNSSPAPIETSSAPHLPPAPEENSNGYLNPPETPSGSSPSNQSNRISLHLATPDTMSSSREIYGKTDTPIKIKLSVKDSEPKCPEIVEGTSQISSPDNDRDCSPKKRRIVPPRACVKSIYVQPATVSKTASLPNTKDNKASDSVENQPKGSPRAKLNADAVSRKEDDIPKLAKNLVQSKPAKRTKKAQASPVAPKLEAAPTSKNTGSIEDSPEIKCHCHLKAEHCLCMVDHIIADVSCAKLLLPFAASPVPSKRTRRSSTASLAKSDVVPNPPSAVSSPVTKFSPPGKKPNSTHNRKRKLPSANPTKSIPCKKKSQPKSTEFVDESGSSENEDLKSPKRQELVKKVPASANAEQQLRLTKETKSEEKCKDSPKSHSAASVDMLLKRETPSKTDIPKQYHLRKHSTADESLVEMTSPVPTGSESVPKSEAANCKRSLHGAMGKISPGRAAISPADDSVSNGIGSQPRCKASLPSGQSRELHHLANFFLRASQTPLGPNSVETDQSTNGSCMSDPESDDSQMYIEDERSSLPNCDKSEASREKLHSSEERNGQLENHNEPKYWLDSTKEVDTPSGTNLEQSKIVSAVPNFYKAVHDPEPAEIVETSAATNIHLGFKEAAKEAGETVKQLENLSPGLPNFYKTIDEVEDIVEASQEEIQGVQQFVQMDSNELIVLQEPDEIIPCSLNILAFASHYTLLPDKKPTEAIFIKQATNTKISNCLNELLKAKFTSVSIKKAEATLKNVNPSHLGMVLCHFVGNVQAMEAVQPDYTKTCYPLLPAKAKKLLLLVVQLANGRLQYFDSILTRLEYSLLPVAKENMSDLTVSFTTYFRNLATFYAVLCRSQGLGLRCQSFIYDCLYSRRISSFLIINTILYVFPWAIPKVQNRSAGPLSYTIGYLILKQGIFASCPPSYLTSYKVESLRKKLAFKCGYRFSPDITRDHVMAELLSKIKCKGCDLAIVLLCKSQGFKWTQSVANKFFFPILNNWINGDENDETLVVLTVQILGKISRGFACSVGTSFVSTSLKYMNLMLRDKTSLLIADAVMESLLHFSRLDMNGVAKIISSWTPSDYRVTKSAVKSVQKILKVKVGNFWDNWSPNS